MWSDPPYRWTLGQLMEQMVDGRFRLEEAEERIIGMRNAARTKRLDVSQFVGIRRSCAWWGASAINDDPICLLEGHHRMIVLAREYGDQLPPCRIFVDSRPLPLEIALLNGKP